MRSACTKVLLTEIDELFLHMALLLRNDHIWGSEKAPLNIPHSVDAQAHVQLGRCTKINIAQSYDAMSTWMLDARVMGLRQCRTRRRQCLCAGTTAGDTRDLSFSGCRQD